MDSESGLFEKMRYEHQEMKDYLNLCLQGESIIPQRKEMLTKKVEALQVSIQELKNSVAYIKWKQDFYDDVGNTPVTSPLPINKSTLTYLFF